MTMKELREEITKRMEEVLKGEPSSTKTERLLVYNEVISLTYREDGNDD